MIGTDETIVTVPPYSINKEGMVTHYVYHNRDQIGKIVKSVAGFEVKPFFGDRSLVRRDSLQTASDKLIELHKEDLLNDA